MMVTDGVMIAADDRWAVRSRVRTWLGSCSRWRRRLSTTTAPCPLAGTRHVLGGIEGERPYRTVSLTKRIEGERPYRTVSLTKRSEGERLSPASMWRSGGSCANTMAAGPRGHDKCALNLTDTKERWNWQVERAQRTGPPGPDVGQGSFRILFLSSPRPGRRFNLERRASTFQDDLRVRNRNVLYLFRFRRSAVEHVVGVSVSRLTNFVADDR